MAFDVTLPQGTLQGLLRAAGRAVSGRAAQPVLQGLLLVATDAPARLCAVGYDMALGVRAQAAAVVKESGSIVAPYRMLSALVNALPEGSMVRLIAEGSDTLRIEAGEGRYSVALSHEPEDFPALPTLDDVEPLGLPFGAIKRALSAVAYAVSTEESKQILCGVEFALKDQALRVSGADGSRISFYELPGIASAAQESSFVVPGPATKELLKLPLQDDDLLLVSFTNAFCLFDAGDVTIITNLIAGSYPSLHLLAPKACSTTVVADRLSLIQAVERANILASAENGTITISYKAKTGDLSVSVANETGTVADLVAAEAGSNGDDFELMISGKYLLDSLRHTETSQVSFAFNDIRLLVVRPVGNELHSQLIATIVKAATKS